MEKSSCQSHLLFVDLRLQARFQMNTNLMMICPNFLSCWDKLVSEKLQSNRPQRDMKIKFLQNKQKGSQLNFKVRLRCPQNPQVWVLGKLIRPRIRQVLFLENFQEQPRKVKLTLLIISVPRDFCKEILKLSNFLSRKKKIILAKIRYNNQIYHLLTTKISIWDLCRSRE